MGCSSSPAKPSHPCWISSAPPPPGQDSNNNNVQSARFSRGVALGNSVYCAPWNSFKLLRIDLTEQGTDYFPDPNNYLHLPASGLASSSAKYGGVASFDGRIYGIPAQANKVFVYDPNADRSPGSAGNGAGATSPPPALSAAPYPCRTSSSSAPAPAPKTTG